MWPIHLIHALLNSTRLVICWRLGVVARQAAKRPQLLVRLTNFWGGSVDNDNNVFVADTWNHRIQKFDANGEFLLEWGIAGVSSEGSYRLWGPRGIAVSPDGRVYVTDTGNKRTVVFNGDGKYLFEFCTEGEGRLDEPVGIATGPDNLVYVADTWNLRVAVFSLDGQFVVSWPVQGWGQRFD